MSCKLGTLWQEGDFCTRQKLQKLVYPDGILYDKHLGSYRTENENEVFRIFRSISTGYIVDKEKAASENSHLSPSVGMRRQHVLRLKFIIFVMLLHKCLNYKRNRN